jgi:tRNA threonylcarbamoyladenosine biosynthesis protein TsaE
MVSASAIILLEEFILYNFTRDLPDEASTLEMGQAFVAELNPGMTIYMHGDLGAGKTTFVRGVLKELGYLGKVKSPTYTLVEPYVFSRFTVYHFDLYRFNDEEEWEFAGFREYFNPQSICFVEWPEKAFSLLPKPDVDIQITAQSTGRIIEFKYDQPKY